MIIDILMWAFTGICCIFLTLFVLSIDYLNRMAARDIESGTATIKDFDAIFVPLGICGTTVLIKKQ